MPIILVFPNKLDPSTFETNNITSKQTLTHWLIENVPDYIELAVPLFSAKLNGQDFPPSMWNSTLIIDNDIIHLTVEAKDPVTIIYAVVAVVAIGMSAYAISNMPDNYNNTTPSGSTIYNANAQGNKARLMGIIPELFGRHKTYPDMLCQPHRYYQDHDQYIELFLSAGVGEYDFYDMMIGYTPIDHYGNDVLVTKFEPGESTISIPNIYTTDEVGGTSGTTGIEIKHSNQSTSVASGDFLFTFLFDDTGKDDGVKVEYETKFDGNYLPVPHGLVVGENVALTGNNEGDYTVKEVISEHIVVFSESMPHDGRNQTISTKVLTQIAQPVGPFQASPSPVKVSEVHLDFLFAQGLCTLSDKGVPQQRVVSIRVWTGDNTDPENTQWTPHEFTYIAETLDQRAFTETIAVPHSQILVKVERLTEDSNDTKIKDKIEWVGLKSTLPPVASYPGITTLHLKLKGTNSIASNAQNKFNVIAQRKFNSVPTRSIKDVFEYIVKDNGHTDAQIPQAELARLHGIWTARGDNFDAIFDAESTIFDSLKRVLAVGYAEPTVDGGQIIPIRDEPRTGFNYMYQPDNMTKPLKRNIKLFDPDEVDGVEVEYFSTKTWKPETVLCLLDGEEGTRPQKVRAYGITDPTKAWQFGMRKRRIIRYRRTEYTFETEMDALNSSYLSYDSLGDDIPGFSQTGRVDAVYGRILELNQPVEFTEGTHFIAVRKPDGTLDGPHVCTMGQHSQQVILENKLGFIADTSGRIEPPLYQFGIAERFNHAVLIHDVTPAGSDSVKVKAWEYDSRVYLDDDNSPPA